MNLQCPLIPELLFPETTTPKWQLPQENATLRRPQKGA
jgi:hypothetical protein